MINLNLIYFIWDYSIKLDNNLNNITTLYELIYRAVCLNGKNDCIGEQIINENGNKEYKWITYNQVSIIYYYFFKFKNKLIYCFKLKKNHKM